MLMVLPSMAVAVQFWFWALAAKANDKLKPRSIGFFICLFGCLVSEVELPCTGRGGVRQNTFRRT
jgi:hypothetical protein